MVATRGQGPYLWDADGKCYIDYRLGFGPLILGHAHPGVNQRVTEVIAGSTMFAFLTPLEIQVAERITRMTGMDKVRLCNTGTEAVMHSLRLARAHTGREKFIKFEGQYHGMSDYFLYSTASSPKHKLGPREKPVPAVTSLGIPSGIGEYVVVLPFNDIEMLEETVSARGNELAAIFVEPLLGNSAGILPKPGFLEKIRELCDRHGILMVMDEVKTGFRIARGGAQEYFGVRADLATYAKAMGNGFPIAAFAGKNEVMLTLEPGSVAQAGTYNGNLVGVAAADATLEILEADPVYEEIYANGARLMEGIDEILDEAGLPHCMTGLPPIFGFTLGKNEQPNEFRDYLDGDRELYERLAFALIQRGVMPDPDGLEPWFLSRAHTAQIIDDTLEAFKEAVWEVKEQ